MKEWIGGTPESFREFLTFLEHREEQLTKELLTPSNRGLVSSNLQDILALRGVQRMVKGNLEKLEKPK